MHVNHYQAKNSDIENVDCEKLLGVKIQSDLSWASHVDSIVKKIKSKMYLLARIKPFLPVSARRQFYNSFILPYFDYCLSIWGCCSQKDMDRLNCLLKRAMRLILNCDIDTPSVEMFTRLQWYPLSYRYKYNLVVSVHKALCGLSPPYIRDMLTVYDPQRSLRSAGNKALKVPFARTELLKQSFRVTAPSLYNELPTSIRSCTSLGAFKHACYNFYRQSFIDILNR